MNPPISANRLFALCIVFLSSLTLTLGCKIGVDESLPPGSGCQTIDCNPGGGGVNTGAKLILDFPIDPANPDRNGLMLEGVDGFTSTLRVRFFPGVKKNPDGSSGGPTALSTLSVSADTDFGGLTIVPFLTLDDVQNNEATFLITVPNEPHLKTKVIKIIAIGTDSGGAIFNSNGTVLVNTHTILTTNPEYDVVTAISFPDLNPITHDSVKLHLSSTLNSDLMLTGVGELIDDPPGRYPAEFLPFYIPIVGKMVLGGGNLPQLNSLPLNIQFPPGTVQDLPGQSTTMKNFCIETAISPDLTNFTGPIKCATGEPVQVELSGLPGLIFPLEGTSTGQSTTPIKITPSSRGLELDLTQVTTAIDVDETTIDHIKLKIFDATTQPDLSIGGKLELIFPPGVDPNEPPVIVNFSTQPIDLVNLTSISNPVSLNVPEGVLQDLGFPVTTKNIQLLMQLTPDFRLNFGAILPGGTASTALADFPIEGASFGKMINPPVDPTDPNMDIDFNELWILGQPGNSTILQAIFTPGSTNGAPSTVTSATITALGNDANKISLSKTSLTAADFVGNVAQVPVSVASGVNITQTTVVGLQISGTDSDGIAFTGYGGLTLKRQGQPPLPVPPPFEHIQYTLRPDMVLSTGDVLKFNAVLTPSYGPPGFLVMAGTASLFDPPGVDFQIPISSSFNAKTREITTTPINTIVTQGALLDLTGVVGVQIADLFYTGKMTPDLKAAPLKTQPGATVIMPNGLVLPVEGTSLLKLTQSVQQGPNDPDVTVNFAPNPVIYSITPGNQATLTVTFIPGNQGGTPTTISTATCTADHNFDVLTTSNFISPQSFVGNVATFTIVPPAGYNPQVGDEVMVYCELVDSAGKKASGGDLLVYSNSPFQPSYALPDFILKTFNTDPEIDLTTPWPNPSDPYPFKGDGLQFVIENQFMTPGLLQPTVTGEAKLLFYTKTTVGSNPKTSHWEPFVDIFWGGQDFVLVTTGAADLHDLTLHVPPFGTNDGGAPGGGPSCPSSGQFGLIPDGPVCFPAGQALEDTQLNGNPASLIVPIINYAINGAFSSDLRSLTVLSALGCSAQLACDGVHFCPFPTQNYGEPCGPNDFNPNPFGVTTKVYGLPTYGTIPVPQNSFGLGTQVP